MVTKAGLFLIAIVLLSAGPLPSVHAAQKEEDVRIVARDDHGMTLELIPPAYSLQDAPDGKRIRVEGWAATMEPGLPDLPVKSVLIQAPVSGDISLEVLDDAFDTVSVEAIRPAGDTGYSRTGSDASGGTTDFLPRTPVRAASRAVIRGVPVARLFFYPFRWNPATGELRRSQRMLVRVGFSEPVSQAVDASSARVESGDPLLAGLDETVLGYRGPENGTPRGGAVSGASTVRPAALRMEVSHDGVYRVSWDDMKKAKAPLSKIDPGTFRLLNRGQEVTVSVVTKKPNRFAKGDYLEFYGQGISTAYTGANVYWLYWGGAPGARPTPIDGTLTGVGPSAESFYSTVHAEENHIVWGNTPGAPDADYWFWAKLIAPASASYSVTVPNPVADGSDAVVRVRFQGYTATATNPDHHTRILLNGAVIGDALWDGAVAYTQEIPISSALLTDGANKVTVTLPGDTSASVNTVMLNWIEIGCARRYRAVNDALTFSAQGNGRTAIQVTGLSAGSIALYDVTDSIAPRPVTGFSAEAAGGEYHVYFEDDLSGAKTYYIATTGLTASPGNPTSWKSAGLSDPSNAADYILITPRDSLKSAAPLSAFRKQQGLRTMAVAVEDIYNEFSYGLPDPQAVKDFLSYAYHSWKGPVPSYVLLLGDATVDYRGYLGTGKISRVPAHFTFEPTVGLVCNDNWLVAVDGDDELPDMMIGRIPAASAKAASGAVQKILAYEKLKAYQPKKALFAADNNSASFQDDNEALIASLPPGYEAERVYLASYASAAVAKQDLISRMNEGMLISSYIGHGDMTHWTGDGLFQSSDVALLANKKKLTFVVSFGCLNGFFALPAGYCLGEEFVAAANGGAVAAFGSSGLDYEWEDQILSEQLFDLIFKSKSAILGAAATQSKIKAYALGTSENTLNNFTLLGDPAARLKNTQ